MAYTYYDSVTHFMKASEVVTSLLIRTELRQVLQETHLTHRAERRQLQLRHGADQVHDRNAIGLCRGVSARRSHNADCFLDLIARFEWPGRRK